MLTRIFGALVAAVLALPAWGQAVQQSGTISAGHAAAWATTGVIRDAGTPSNPGLTSLGLQSTNQCAIGVNNAPIASGYNQFCFGTTTTSGFLAYNAFGGATARPFAFQVNGVNSFYFDAVNNVVFGDETAGARLTTAVGPFPFMPTMAGTPTGVPATHTGYSPFVVNTSAGTLCNYYSAAWHCYGDGSGDVVGPGSSTAADVALFSGTTGKIIQDGSTTTVGNLAGLNVTGSTAPTVGVYRSAASTLGFSVASALAGSLTATVMTMPAYAVTGSTVPANGMYLSAANTVGFAANTTLAATVTATGLNNTVIGATTAAAASFTSITASTTYTQSASASGDLWAVGTSANSGTGFVINSNAANVIELIGTQSGALNAISIRATNSPESQFNLLTSGLITMPAMTTDATLTSRTVCQNTANSALHFGSGAAGICLGTSSARFKDVRGPMRAGLGDVMRWQTVAYRYNEASHMPSSKDLYGFTAEQVYTVTPEIVGLDSEGRENSIDMMGMIPILTKAIQEQQAEIAEMKSRLN